MTKTHLTAPLSNITNQGKKQGSHTHIKITEVEQSVLLAHNAADREEICAMHKYIPTISSYYESMDTLNTFIEKDVTFEMRSELVDWLIGCHTRAGLSDDTLHLCIYIMDKFLSDRSVSTSKLQLVALTCLFVSSKYEEVLSPDLNSFVMLGEQRYTEGEIRKAEKYLLYSLNYDIRCVNPLYFIRRVSKANNYESRTRKMGKYFLELMCLYSEFYSFTKSVLATTAMYLSRKICQTDINKNIFFLYSKLDRKEIKDCFEKLVHLINKKPLYSNLETKYSKDSMDNVAVIAREFARKHFN